MKTTCLVPVLQLIGLRYVHPVSDHAVRLQVPAKMISRTFLLPLPPLMMKTPNGIVMLLSRVFHGYLNIQDQYGGQKSTVPKRTAECSIVTTRSWTRQNHFTNILFRFRRNGRMTRSIAPLQGQLERRKESEARKHKQLWRNNGLD